MRLVLVGLVALFVGATLSALGGAQYSGPLTSTYASGLACNVNADCTPYWNNLSANRSRAAIVNVSNFTNAHAEVLDPATSTYGLSVCCWGVPGLSGACDLSGTSRPVNVSGDPDAHDAVFLLSNKTNAHAEQYPRTPQVYSVNACLGVGVSPLAAGAPTSVDCRYSSSCGALGAGYVCVASLSNATNAHVGGCTGTGAYTTKVCCRVTSDDTPPSPVFSAPSAACSTTISTNYTFVNVSDAVRAPISACRLEWANSSGVFDMMMTPAATNGHYCTLNVTANVSTGTYWYRAMVNDSYGNFNWTENCSVTVNTDILAPNSSVTVPNASASPYNSSRWTGGGAVKGAAGDNVGVSGVELAIHKTNQTITPPATYKWWWDGTGWTQTKTWVTATVQGSGTSVTWSYSWTPHDENFNITSRAWDLGGNYEVPGDGTLFTYDDSAPDSSLNSHASPSGDVTPTFTGTATDGTTNVRQIEYRVANLNPPYDDSGWRGLANTSDFTPGLSPTFAFTISPPLSETSYNISVRSNDSAGNLEQSVAFQVLDITTAAPFSQINDPNVFKSPYNQSEWNSSSIAGNASDNGGIKNVSVRIKRQSDGQFWNGNAWQSAEVWRGAQMTDANQASTAWNYTWNATADGTYNLSSRAEDLGSTFEEPTPVLIVYDTSAPAGLVVTSQSPLPTWSNATSWPIGWTAEEMDGFNQTVMEWQANSTSANGWAYLATSYTPETWTFNQGGSLSIVDATRYYFRLHSWDNAGNNVTNGSDGRFNTTTDFTKPVTTVTSPGFWTRNPFDVLWSATDTGSGVNWTNATFSTDKATWTSMSSLAGCTVNATGAYGCFGTDSVTYYFKANTIDVAGNKGLDSAIVNTTVDTSAPTTAFVKLPAWSRSTQLNLSWSGSDNAGSGVGCYMAQWNTTGGWQNVTRDASACLGPGQRWELFGPSFPTTLVDGSKVSFQLRANDTIGNLQGWPAEGDAQRFMNTTIDTGVPKAFLRAVDQNGAAINGVVAGKGVSRVTIIANATDWGSGLGSNLIEYWTTSGNIASYATKECGSAANASWSNCTVDVDFTSGSQLRYRATARDLAGNENKTALQFVVTHPLVNFVTHDLFITLGSSFVADLQVRNLLGKATNITMNLTGYELGAFVSAGAGNYSISGNGRRLTALEMGPQEERTYRVELVSSDPQSYVPSMNVTANNSASGAEFITDADTMTVVVGFPASFSGLNAWAVALLILAAVLVYFFVSREPLPASRGRRHR